MESNPLNLSEWSSSRCKNVNNNKNIRRNDGMIDSNSIQNSTNSNSIQNSTNSNSIQNITNSNSEKLSDEFEKNGIPINDGIIHSTSTQNSTNSNSIQYIANSNTKKLLDEFRKNKMSEKFNKGGENFRRNFNLKNSIIFLLTCLLVLYSIKNISSIINYHINPINIKQLIIRDKNSLNSQKYVLGENINFSKELNILFEQFNKDFQNYMGCLDKYKSINKSYSSVYEKLDENELIDRIVELKGYTELKQYVWDVKKDFRAVDFEALNPLDFQKQFELKKIKILKEKIKIMKGTISNHESKIKNYLNIRDKIFDFQKGLKVTYKHMSMIETIINILYPFSTLIPFSLFVSLFTAITEKFRKKFYLIILLSCLLLIWANYSIRCSNIISFYENINYIRSQISESESNMKIIVDNLRNFDQSSSYFYLFLNKFDDQLTMKLNKSKEIIKEILEDEDKYLMELTDNKALANFLSLKVIKNLEIDKPEDLPKEIQKNLVLFETKISQIIINTKQYYYDVASYSKYLKTKLTIFLDKVKAKKIFKFEKIVKYILKFNDKLMNEAKPILIRLANFVKDFEVFLEVIEKTKRDKTTKSDTLLNKVISFFSDDKVAKIKKEFADFSDNIKNIRDTIDKDHFNVQNIQMYLQRMSDVARHDALDVEKEEEQIFIEYMLNGDFDTSIIISSVQKVIQSNDKLFELCDGIRYAELDIK